MHPRRRLHPAKLAKLAAIAIAALLGATCGREPTGPGVSSSDVTMARGIALSLEFPSGKDPTRQVIEPLDRIRFTFARLDGTTALDSTVRIGAFADSLVLRFTVPLSRTAPITGEPMDVLVRCIAPLGDTVYSGGPVRALIRPGAASSPVAVALRHAAPPPVPTVTHLAFNTLAVTTIAGALLGGSGGVGNLTVSALDAAGRPVTSFTQPITVALGTNPRGATLGGTTTATPSSGVATFRDLWIGKASPGYTLVASTAGVPAATSPMFTITAAAAHAIALLGGQAQAGIIGTLLPTPMQVAVSDVYGNAVSGTSVRWQVLTGGGTLLNPSTTTDATGATTNQWTIGQLLGSQSASATVDGLTGSPVLFSATGLPVASAGWHLIFAVTGPIGTTVAGAPIGAAGGVTVRILDAAGALVTSFNGPVTMAIGQNPSGASLGGTTTRTAQGGIATFDDLSITKAATGYTLVASAAGLPNITSNTFGIVAAAARALSLVSGNNQSALINLLLPSPLRVAVADAFGNPVSGTPVVWSVLTGGGSLTSSSSTTDGTGVASNGWTLGLLLGTQIVNAAVSGLTGSPVAFNASGLPLQQTATQMVMSAIPLTSIAGVVLDAVIPASSRGEGASAPMDSRKNVPGAKPRN